MTELIRKKFGKYLVLIYSATIVLLSVLPINSINTTLNSHYVIDIRLDYFSHFIIYMPWVILTGWVFGVSLTPFSVKAFILTIISLSFAAGNELIQYFLPYRAFNVNDLLANVLGVSAGMITLIFLKD